MLKPNWALPSPRRDHALVQCVRALWTLPTNVVGHTAGLLCTGRLPRAVRGPSAVGYVYWVPARLRVAVALGHAILISRERFRPEVLPYVLAHELAHTRQHDVLGPLYLPLHITAQSISFLLSLILPGRVPSRVHAYNPLEQTFLCLGASLVWQLDRAGEVSLEQRDELMVTLGLNPSALRELGLL